MFLVQNILAIISLITNGLLIFLIITKSPKTMGSYKYLMIFMSSFEILYALIDLLIHPKVFTMHTIFLTAISAERSLLPLNVSYPLMLIWGGSFGIALASFGIHFVYRYLTVTGNKTWTTGYSIVLWISIPVLSGFFFAFAIDFFWQLSDVMDNFVRKKLAEFENSDKDKLLYFSSYLFKSAPDAEVSELDWMQIYGIIFLCSSVSISFFTMIYFGLKTYFAMKKFQETASSPSKKMQAQLFYSLVLQTLIPLILIHVPTTVIYLSSCFGVAFPIYGEFITITISMFPAIDPLPSLIIIKPYRQAIKGIFRKQWTPKSASVDPSNRGISTTNRAVTF